VPTLADPLVSYEAQYQFSEMRQGRRIACGTLSRNLVPRDDGDNPPRRAGRDLSHGADQSRDPRPLDRQRRFFVPVLGVPATTRQGL